MTRERYLIDLINRGNDVVEEFRSLEHSLSIEEIRSWIKNNEALYDEFSIFIFESPPTETGKFDHIFHELNCALKLYDDRLDLQPCINHFDTLDLKNKQDLLHFLTKFERELTQSAFMFVKIIDDNKFLLFEDPYIMIDENDFRKRFEVNKKIASKFWRYYNCKRYQNIEIANFYLTEIMEGL